MLWIEEIVESKPDPQFFTNSRIQALFFLSMYFFVLFQLSIEMDVSSLLYRKIVETRAVELESSFFLEIFIARLKSQKFLINSPRFTSLRNCILPDKFRADYIGRLFFIFAQNFENWRNPDAWKDWREIFSSKLWKFSRQFQKFHPVQEIIKVKSFSIVPKNLGTLEKSLCLKISGIRGIFMLQIVSGPVHRVKKVWISTQTFWALWKKS